MVDKNSSAASGPAPYGSVFQTFLVVDNRPVDAPVHIEHMLEITGVDIGDFLQSVTADLHGYHRVRIDCAEPGELSADITDWPMPAILRGEFDQVQSIVAALPGEKRDTGHGHTKRSDRSILAGVEADTLPIIPLLVDSRDFVMETTRQNVFIIEGDSIVTPPLDGRILPGTTRETVLGIATETGIKHSEEPVTLTRALQSDGMFLTNSLSGILWVSHCEDAHWPDIPPVAQKLHHLLGQRWHAQTG